MASRAVIRRLWIGERERIRDHLLRLEGEDRLLRFGGYASDAHIAAYGERLDWSRVLVVGYVAGGEIRGLAQLDLIGGAAPCAAEVAVSVERPFRQRGVGTGLLRRLVLAARNRLIERMHMVCLMDNGRAIRLARRAMAPYGSVTAGPKRSSSRHGPPPGPCWRRRCSSSGAPKSTARQRRWMRSASLP